MGLLAKLFSDASDADFKLAQDLVAIAMADGEISEAERTMIARICQSEGISDEALQEFLLGFDGEPDAQVPVRRSDKMSYLTKLIRVMGVDGYSSHMEIYLLEMIASKLGVGHFDLVSLVLMTATHRNFSGDTGQRALASFLQNVIDPRGKTLCDNRQGLRTLFDLIAQNIPQLQDAEEDRLAFERAMNTTTDLLLENALLCNEFRAMGIDFETVLMTEREQALRRWMERT